MNVDVEAKVAAAVKWCQETPEVVYPITMGNNSTYIESGAVFTGSALEEAKVLDKLLQEAMKKNDTLVEAFKKAPLNGCISVMTIARTKSGFIPTDISDPQGTAKFNQYSKNLQSSPFFHLKMSEVSHVEHTEKNWSDTIQKIMNLYTGISQSDKNKIETSIQSLAAAATSKAGTKQTENLFTQSTINYDGSQTIEVYVYWSYIELVYEKGKSTSTQSKVDVTKLQLEFDKYMWPYYAEMVLKYNISFIEEWLKENAQPITNDIKRLCFYHK